MRSLLLFFCFCCIQTLSAQDWELSPLAEMPEGVSNNSVVAAEVNGKEYVYSFAGIDETKLYSGIHNKCWRYDVAADVWDTIPDLPDPLGKIALGVSVVNGVAYIMGGYHVFSNLTELTSEKVHRFDLATNSYLTDGAPIPLPVDDHIQVVYKDSLIYLATGWSGNTSSGTNVANVQIYDPANDSWQVATSVPDNNSYKVFGASGVLIDNSIYYFGGCKIQGNAFNSSYDLRVGIIDENDPTQITWSFESTSFRSYRPAGAVSDGKAYFLGGANGTYNFNGLAYNGSGGVSPNRSSLLYDQVIDTIIQRKPFDDMPMDLRSLGELNNGDKIIAGGMESGQVVSKKTWLLKFVPVDYVPLKTISRVPELKVYPNPAKDFVAVEQGDFINIDEIKIVDGTGRVLEVREFEAGKRIDLTGLGNGQYVLLFYRDEVVVGRAGLVKVGE